MVKEGPCYHCGIKSTPLWRNGPPNKPVLCNACGSRWRTRGTLDDYVPKHAMYNNIQMYYNNKRMYQNLKKNQNIQTNELPANKQPDQTDSNPPDDANAAGPSEPGFEDVPRRRRSHLDQVVKSPIERLHKQLCDVMKEEPEIFKKSVIGDVLINRVDNKMFAENETALGAMLLNSQPEDLEPSESVSSSNMKMFDAFASCGNDGNGDGTALPKNDGNHGDHGASSST